MVSETLESALRRFVDEHRARCLWFFREDYYPETAEARRRVLDLIERHGDVQALKEAAHFHAWLSRSSNETSAAS